MRIKLIFFILFLFTKIISQINNKYESEGDFYYNKELYQKAIIAYTKDLNLNPNNIETCNKRGKSYLQLSQFNLAIADFSKVINSKAKQVTILDAYRNRSYCYLSTEKYEKCLKDCNAFLEWFSDDIEILSYRADSYFNLNKYDKAATDYTKLLNDKPAAEDKLYYLYNRSVSYLNTDSFDYALSDINNAISIDSTDYAKYLVRYEVYINLSNYNKAKDDLFRARKLDPTYKHYAGKFGVLFYFSENYEKAIDSLNKQLKIDTKNASLYSFRSSSYMKLQNYPKSMVDIDKCIALRGKESSYLNSKGWIYLLMKEYKKGLIILNEAIASDSKNADCYDSRGCILYYLKDFKAALNDFNNAIKLNENYSNSYFYRAKCMIEFKDFKNACINLDLVKNNNYSLFPEEKKVQDLKAEFCK